MVVSANYRSGFEGFARLAGAPDNRALLDQLAALRWVQENIAGFGGASDTVTLLGQSAGRLNGSLSVLRQGVQQRRDEHVPGQAAQRVEVAPNALVFSYQHQVRVEEL